MLTAFIVLAVCMAIGVPVAYSLGIASLSFLAFSGIPLTLLAQRMFTGLDSFPIMAVPFFILAGELMNRCGITKRIVEFCDVFVGNFRGGLAHVNIVASMFFAGITGSAVADTSAIGSMLIPAMEEKGFDTEFSAAVTASSSVIGPIIPPSIPFVVYAMISGNSVGALLLSGFAPGVLLGISLMVVTFFYSRKRNYPRSGRFPTWREILRAAGEAVIPLLMPIIILGGILSGIFTATEAAAVAVLYALIIGVIVFRKLSGKDLVKVALHTAKTTGIVFLVMATANILNWLMASEQIPQRVAEFVFQYVQSPVAVLMVLNVMLLILGCFMEGTAAMIMTVPIILEIGNRIGINPIHMGAIVVLNLMIGLITPPLGLCLYVACSVSKLSLERLSKAIVPFLIAEIVTLMLVTYIPAISLTIPRWFGYIK